MRHSKPGKSRSIYFPIEYVEALEHAIENNKDLGEICGQALLAEMKHNTFALEKTMREREHLQRELDYLDSEIQEMESARDDNQELITERETFDQLMRIVRNTLIKYIKTGAGNFTAALFLLEKDKTLFEGYARRSGMSRKEFMQNAVAWLKENDDITDEDVIF